MKKISISSAIGRDIESVIDYPDIITQKLAILCPGYSDSRDYEHLSYLGQILLDKGYTVVRFDPTGTWEADEETAEYSTTEYLSDIKRTLEHMKSEGDYSHILVAGHDWGGQVAILCAALDPRVVRVLAILPENLPDDSRVHQAMEKVSAKVILIPLENWREVILHEIL